MLFWRCAQTLQIKIVGDPSQQIVCQFYELFMAKKSETERPTYFDFKYLA